MAVETAELALDSVTSWSLEGLRKTRFEPHHTRIFAKSTRMGQRIYEFDTEWHSSLAIRFTEGIRLRSSLNNLIWVRAQGPNDSSLMVGLEPAYIFEQTGCLLNPKIVQWGGAGLVSLFEIVAAVLSELEGILGFQTLGFLPEVDWPLEPPLNYLTVDHLHQSKLLVVAPPGVLQQLELQAREYCPKYWADYESMAKKVRFELLIGLRTRKRLWSEADLADLEVGDLLALEYFQDSDSSYSLRGNLRFRSKKFSTQQYEVFLNMNDDDTRLQLGRDDAFGEDPNSGSSLEPHEQIELEIHAGKTRLLFSELCTVQEGTLIEIKEHALPMVTLCVMGEPILEGELVHFQDQIMIQVTRRLD